MKRSFKGRKLDPKRPVEVYRNVTRGGYSVRQDGKVVAHVDHCTLIDAEFVVQEAGRQRVLREGRKNVHAWVRGQWVNARGQEHEDMERVRYNPSLDEQFVYETIDNMVDGMELRRARNARIVYLNSTGCYAWRVNAW